MTTVGLVVVLLLSCLSSWTDNIIVLGWVTSSLYAAISFAYLGLASSSVRV